MKSTAPLGQINFESPTYLEGQDVIGVDGWFDSTFSKAGATSVVSSAYGDDQLKPLVTKLIAARQALESVELKLDSLESKRIATQAKIDSTNARIAADRAKYGETKVVVACRVVAHAANFHNFFSTQLLTHQILTQGRC